MAEMEELEPGAAVGVVNSGVAVVEVNSRAAVVEAGLAVAWCRRTTTGKEKPAGQVHSLQWSSGNLFGRACTLIRRATPALWIISCQAKTSRGASPQAKGNGRPRHRRPSSGLVLEMRRQLADSWQMRWREHLRRSCPGLVICSPHFVTRMQTLLGPICKSYWEFWKIWNLFWPFWFGSLVQFRSGHSHAGKLSGKQLWWWLGSWLGNWFCLGSNTLAFMAAGLERCGRSEAQRVCPRSAEEPDLLFGQ